MFPPACTQPITVVVDVVETLVSNSILIWFKVKVLVAAPGTYFTQIRSPDTTVSVFVVSSNQPVADEPTETVWLPAAPFFLKVNIVVPATEFALILTPRS